MNLLHLKTYNQHKKQMPMYNLDYEPKTIGDCKSYLEWLDDHIFKNEFTQLDTIIEDFCKKHDRSNMLSLDECINDAGLEETIQLINDLKSKFHYNK